MFLKKTYISPSSIHGLGLFAAEPIQAGEQIRMPSSNLTLHWSHEEFELLPEDDRRIISHYGYFHKEHRVRHLSADDSRYINHSATPTIEVTPDDGVRAIGDIPPGTELTQNYSDFEEIRTF
jgi:SET domain-containing protein